MLTLSNLQRKSHHSLRFCLFHIYIRCVKTAFYVCVCVSHLTGPKQVETILPEALYSSIGESLNAKLQKPQYARVLMPLASLLEGEFFNAYIKIGA